MKSKKKKEEKNIKKKAHIIRASHSKKFSSSTGPAMIPSGGFRVNSEKKKIRIWN